MNDETLRDIERQHPEVLTRYVVEECELPPPTGNEPSLDFSIPIPAGPPRVTHYRHEAPLLPDDLVDELLRADEG
jgi:hypothetical protein